MTRLCLGSRSGKQTNVELDLAHHTLGEAMRVHVRLVQDLQGDLLARHSVQGAIDAPEASAANDLMVGRRGRREEVRVDAGGRRGEDGEGNKKW